MLSALSSWRRWDGCGLGPVDKISWNYTVKTAWFVDPNMDLSFHSKCQRKLW